MKNGFIYGGILVAIGFVMLTVADVIGGDNVFDVNEKQVEKTYTFSGDYSEIIYNENNSDILIKESPDENIHFITYVTEDEYYDIKDEDKLTITYIGDNEWDMQFFIINFDYKEYESELYIPASMEPKLVLDSINGDVRIQDLVFNAVDIFGNNGDIEVDNVTTIEEFKLETKNGDSDIYEVKAKGFKVVNRNGDINIDTVDADEFLIKNENGDIDVTNGYSNKTIEIYNSNGDINFENIDFESSLEAENRNGDIEGYLQGSENDYSFELVTSHGEIYINNDEITGDSYGKGSKTVRLSNTNGDINVETNR